MPVKQKEMRYAPPGKTVAQRIKNAERYMALVRAGNDPFLPKRKKFPNPIINGRGFEANRG